MFILLFLLGGVLGSCGPHGCYDASSGTCLCDEGWRGANCTYCSAYSPGGGVYLCCKMAKTDPWMLVAAPQIELPQFLLGLYSQGPCVYAGTTGTSCDCSSSSESGEDEEECSVGPDFHEAFLLARRATFLGDVIGSTMSRQTRLFAEASPDSCAALSLACKSTTILGATIATGVITFVVTLALVFGCILVRNYRDRVKQEDKRISEAVTKARMQAPTYTRLQQQQQRPTPGPFPQAKTR